MTAIHSGLLPLYPIRLYPLNKGLRFQGSPFFMDKNLPITDIFARVSFFDYDTDTTKQRTPKEVTIMRHVYIRGTIGLIWLAAAIVSGVSGNFEMSMLYVILGCVFLYSAYTTWKKDKDNKGDR